VASLGLVSPGVVPLPVPPSDATDMSCAVSVELELYYIVGYVAKAQKADWHWFVSLTVHRTPIFH